MGANELKPDVQFLRHSPQGCVAWRKHLAAGTTFLVVFREHSVFDSLPENSK